MNTLSELKVFMRNWGKLSLAESVGGNRQKKSSFSTAREWRCRMLPLQQSSTRRPSTKTQERYCDSRLETRRTSCLERALIKPNQQNDPILFHVEHQPT